MIKFKKINKLKLYLNIDIDIITNICSYKNLVIFSDFKGKIFYLDMKDKKIHKIMNLGMNIFSITVIKNMINIGLNNEIRTYNLDNYELVSKKILNYEGLMKLFKIEYKKLYLVLSFLNNKIIIINVDDLTIDKVLNFDDKIIYDFYFIKEKLYVLCANIFIILDDNFKILKKINLEYDFKKMQIIDNTVILASEFILFYDFSKEKEIFKFEIERTKIKKKMDNKYESYFNKEIDSDDIVEKKDSNYESYFKQEKDNDNIIKTNKKQILKKIEINSWEVFHNILFIGVEEKIILFEINSKQVLMNLSNTINPKKVLKFDNNNLYVGGLNSIDIYNIEYTESKEISNGLEIVKNLDVIFKKIKDLVFQIEVNTKKYNFNYDSNCKSYIIWEILKLLGNEYIIKSKEKYDLYCLKILEINKNFIIHEKDNEKILINLKELSDIIIKFKNKLKKIEIV